MLESLPQDRYVKVGNINTRFWQAGDTGSAVVMVHGTGGSIENWERNINVLAGRHRVYAMDLLGFGRTDKLPLVKDLYLLVQFISDFMDIQNISKASLVGNSLGGGLVLAFAIQFPQKVEKLVLVSNAGMGRSVTRSLSLPSLPLVGELLVRPNLKGTARLMREVFFDASLVTPGLVEQAYKMAALPGATRALLSVIRASINLRGQRTTHTKRILRDLDKITMPTLIFWGKQDRIIPVAHAQIAAAKIPGAKLHIFDNCGHCAMYEHPDEFNKIVLGFLAE